MFDKGHLDATDWVKAFAYGILAALPAGYAGLTRPLGKGLGTLFSKTPAVVEQAELTLPSWIVDSVGGDSTLDALGTWGQEMADLFENFELEDLASGAAP